MHVVRPSPPIARESVDYRSAIQYQQFFLQQVSPTWSSLFNGHSLNLPLGKSFHFSFAILNYTEKYESKWCTTLE